MGTRGWQRGYRDGSEDTQGWHLGHTRLAAGTHRDGSGDTQGWQLGHKGMAPGTHRAGRGDTQGWQWGHTGLAMGHTGLAAGAEHNAQEPPPPAAPGRAAHTPCWQWAQMAKAKPPAGIHVLSQEQDSGMVALVGQKSLCDALLLV